MSNHKNGSTFKEKAEQVQLQDLAAYYVDEKTVDELAKALATKAPEKVKRRSGWLRSGLRGKL